MHEKNLDILLVVFRITCGNVLTPSLIPFHNKKTIVFTEKKLKQIQ